MALGWVVRQWCPPQCLEKWLQRMHVQWCACTDSACCSMLWVFLQENKQAFTQSIRLHYYYFFLFQRITAFHLCSGVVRQLNKTFCGNINISEPVCISSSTPLDCSVVVRELKYSLCSVFRHASTHFHEGSIWSCMLGWVLTWEGGDVTVRVNMRPLVQVPDGGATCCAEGFILYASLLFPITDVHWTWLESKM